MFSYQRRLFFPVEIKKKDPEMANILMESYGGRYGELSSAMQYFNHKAKMTNSYIRDLMGMVAAEELGHLELLGNIILKLSGEYPNYFNSSKTTWNMDYIVQTGNEAEMLEIDEESEIISNREYIRVLSLIKNGDLHKVLFFLANREEVHHKLIRKARFLLLQGANNEKFSALIHEYKMSIRIIE